MRDRLRPGRSLLPLALVVSLTTALAGFATSDAASSPSPATPAPAAATPALSSEATAIPSPSGDQSGGLLAPAPSLPASEQTTFLAAATAELDLRQQMQDDILAADVIGTDGTAVLADIQNVETTFGQGALANLVQQTGIDLTATDRSVEPLAMVLNRPVDAWSGSLLGYTSFMTSTWLGMAPQAIRTFAGNDTYRSESLPPRNETHDGTVGNLKEHLVLSEQVSISAGQGRLAFDVTLSSSSDMTDAASGAAVAHRTTMDTGHFDVNACPDVQGIAEGKYTLVDREDVSNAGGVSNGGTASTEATFRLVDGSDAHLVQTQVEANINAAAHGARPSTDGSAGAPFDWNAGASYPMTIPAAGSVGYGTVTNLTSSDGTTAHLQSLGSLVAMAANYLAEAARQAEKFWRSGGCIVLKTNEESRTVSPNEQVSLTVDSTHKWDKQPVTAPIVAAFSGTKSLDPAGTPQPPTATLTVIAGPNQGDKGTVDLTQTGVRGIGTKTVEFTVAGTNMAFAGVYKTPYGHLSAPVGAVSCTADLNGPWAVLSFGNPAFKITLGNLVAQMNSPKTSKYVEIVQPGQPFQLVGESVLQGVLTPSVGPPATMNLHVTLPGGGGYSYSHDYALSPVDPSVLPKACQ
jgi:hypothetical protein